MIVNDKEGTQMQTMIENRDNHSFRNMRGQMFMTKKKMARIDGING